MKVVELAEVLPQRATSSKYDHLINKAIEVGYNKAVVEDFSSPEIAERTASSIRALNNKTPRHNHLRTSVIGQTVVIYLDPRKKATEERKNAETANVA
jgi:hypothetical protein